MCCDSHRCQGPNASKYIHPPLLDEHGNIQWLDVYTPLVDERYVLHAKNHTSETDRCKCRGFDRLAVGKTMGQGDSRVAYESAACQCQRQLTEEDLRCDVCRAWCTPDSTPRISVADGLAAYERMLARSAAAVS